MNFIYLFLSFLSIQPAEDSHQMYLVHLVPGKTSTIGIETSPTLPNFYTGGGQIVQNLASFKISLNFEPPAFENAAYDL